MPHLWHVREIYPRVPLLRSAYARLVRALSDHTLFMTRACEQGLFGTADHARSSILFDAIDLARWPFGAFAPQRIRAKLGVPVDAPLVGFAARLDPWKGLPVFIAAMAEVARKVPDAHFLVAGGAPGGFAGHEANCRALADRLGLAGRMHFAGWRFGPDDMPDVMAALDVFCHTAVEPEPFGLVLIEAMASVAPLIAARAGGPVEIVIDGTTGHLTPPGDPDALARAVIGLLADPDRARSMALAARARVEAEFAADVFAERLHTLYDRLARAGPTVS